MLHTILGAGGAVGNALTSELLNKNLKFRLVSRRGFGVEGAEAVKADLSDKNQTFSSVAGSDVVYLCAGLQYDYKVWIEQWPKIIENVLEACKRSGSKLIFLDNVYMYGLVKGKMIESTPYNPCSKKGELRAKLARKIEA